jgi:hypothetical protein
MFFGFTTSYAIRAYHHWCEFEYESGRCVQHYHLCDKVCQWIATGRWFSPGSPVSSINKTDRHNITTNFIVFGLTWSGLKPLIYSTWCKQANHYTTNWVANFERMYLFIRIFPKKMGYNFLENVIVSSFSSYTNTYVFIWSM